MALTKKISPLIIFDKRRYLFFKMRCRRLSANNKWRYRMKKVIGREREIQLLQEVWNSTKAEFVAVYGRRRVGKTYLIREFFQSKGFYLEFTGVKDGNKHEQLARFTETLARKFYPEISLQPPPTWHAAFELLSSELMKLPKSKKVTLFFDELPWMATKKSGLIQALDYFWNTRWSQWRQLKLIVCGSAASWMLDHLINAKGGLYNRLTHTLQLSPFNLLQTKQFLSSRGFHWKPIHVADLYLVMGGIPHYLEQIKKSKSVIQNIDSICFQQDGLLYNEFSRLYPALFDDPELSIRIMRIISKHHHGVSKEILVREVGKTTGGRFDKRLDELAASGFIQGFIPYGHKKRDQFFRVTDEYTLFYLKWIAEFAEHRSIALQNKSYWTTVSNTSAWYSWAGYAFEILCFKHIDNILEALGIAHIPCKIGSWRYAPLKKSSETGAQIDLLFDRADHVITLCEIKYSHKPFVIDKAYAQNLKNKIETFERHFPTHKQVNLALITPFGLKPSIWSEELVSHEIDLLDLFVH